MKPLEITGATIQGRRRALGYTQQQMADILNKSIESYRKKKRGEVGFSLNEAVTVAEALGFSLDDFNEAFLNGKLTNQRSRGTGV